MEGNEGGDGYARAEALPQRMGDVLPAHLLPCFGYETLTKVQQRVLRAAFKERGNMMVCAPTGSGKTAVLEAAFLQCHERSRGVFGGKAVYIAPVKALLQERLKDWRSRFGEQTIGMRFVELSGDSTDVDANKIASADVLLTTPEKWDAIMRNKQHSGVRPSPVLEIELLLVDEIHHIGDVSRGATLEAVLCQMMNIAKHENNAKSGLPIENLRIVGLSASFSNASDLSSWIDSPPANLFEFGSEYRPVPLDCRVIGCGDAKTDFTFERSLDGRVAEIIRQFSDGKPSLVFCNSRNATTRLAAFLGQELKRMGIFDSKKRERQSFLDQVKERPGKMLEVALQNGVGYHHAGLTPSERGLVETLFKTNKMLILCSTSSLAVGVNLVLGSGVTGFLHSLVLTVEHKPAHLVIIKSTRIYQGCEGYVEYPESQLLQMVGRAGRPGFDSSGTAILLAEDKRVASLEMLMSGESPILIRSQLATNLLGVVNAEIDRGSIANSTDAHDWIQSTFYASQLQRENGWNTEAELSKVDAVIEQLSKTSLVSFSETGQIASTVAGSTMCRGCVRFSTMVSIASFGDTHSSMADLLKAISCWDEVRLPVRRQEKVILNQLRESSVRHRLRLSQEKWTGNFDEAKANILIQATLSGAIIPDERLVEESLTAISEAERLLGAMVEYLSRVGNAEALLITIRLLRSLRLRRWDDATGRLSLKGICDDEIIAASLEYIGIRSIRHLANADPLKIDELLRRKIPLGKQLVESARMLKEFRVTTAWESKRRIARRSLKISVSSLTCEKEGTATLLVWTAKKLLHYQAKINQAYEVALEEGSASLIHIRLLHDMIPGLDIRLDVETAIRFATLTTEKKSAVPVTLSPCAINAHKTPERSGQSSILKSILQLESHHSRVRQQDISQFMVKKKRSSPERSMTKKGVVPSFTSIPIEHIHEVLPQPLKRARTELKHRKSKSTKVSSKREGRCGWGVESGVVSLEKTPMSTRAKDKTVTNVFDKFRFKRVDTKAPQELPESSARSASPPMLEPCKVEEKASPRSGSCGIPSVKHDYAEDHPFLRTYLQHKEEDQRVQSYDSVLGEARSSLEYSLFQRVLDQHVRPFDTQFEGVEEESTIDPCAAHIIASDDPFSSIFF